MGDPVPGTDAALMQLFSQGERLERIDARETDHYKELAGKLTDIARTLSGLKGTVADQADILRPLAGIDEKIDELGSLVAGLLPKEKGPSDDYEPRPTVKWWKLRDAEQEPDREAAVSRLSYWISRIFIPGYGYLSAMLPSCWADHEFCLYTLDWLCESWSVLYLTEERSTSTLAAQAEFQTRILPVACDQFRREAQTCRHRTGAR